MDIVKIVNGRKIEFCLPASQYVAGLIEKDIHEEYDLEVVLMGTGARIKKHSKKKYVDYHDKEHISYIRTQRPPIELGGLYWEASKDLAVFYKSNSEEENTRLKKEGVLQIPYDIFRHLRDEDIVEINGTDVGKNGKDIRLKFRGTKEYIKQFGKIEQIPESMPFYIVPKDKFSRNFLVTPPAKITKKRNFRKGGV